MTSEGHSELTNNDTATIAMVSNCVDHIVTDRLKNYDDSINVSLEFQIQQGMRKLYQAISHVIAKQWVKWVSEWNYSMLHGPICSGGDKPHIE